MLSHKDNSKLILTYLLSDTVLSSTTGCHIEGWCYRSMKKNLEPHHVSVRILIYNRKTWT